VSFASPQFLIGLAAVPLLVVAYAIHDRRRRRALSRFATPALLPSVVDRSPGWRRHLPVAVLLAALAAMIVGVARPRATLSLPRQEATVIIAVDTSLSMSANDVKPSRLARARRIALDFAERVPSSYQIAVVSFATHAVATVPPTTDRSLVASGLQLLHLGTGTALGDAIVLSTRIARAERTSDGVVPPAALLLITDGAPDGGKTSLPEAIQAAVSAHIPVYSVLVGTPAGTIEAALTGGYREQVRVAANPGTLQAIAKATGGEAFSSGSDPRLRDVYARLSSRLGRRRGTREISNLFAGGSALLVLCGSALSVLWFRRIV
jgi:Ca-activated chloride channel family protein